MSRLGSPFGSRRRRAGSIATSLPHGSGPTTACFRARRSKSASSVVWPGYAPDSPPAFSAAVAALALPGSRLTSVAVVLVAPSKEVEGVVLGARLVSPARRSVEPLVHAPERVEPARVGGVRVVDDAVLQREGAHPGPFPRVRGPVRARGGRPRRERSLCGRLGRRLRRPF